MSLSFRSMIVSIAAMFIRTNMIAPPMVGDTCASVTPVAMAFGDTINVTGTTVGKGDDYNTNHPNTGIGSPDAVFGFTLSGSGSLRVRLNATSPDFKTVMYIRSSCDVEQYLYTLGEGTQEAAQHMSAGTYYLIVDSKDGSEGSFSVTLDFEAPKCGDSIVNPGEGCDTGLNVPWDGCGDPWPFGGCHVEAPGLGDSCPGVPIALPLGLTTIADQTTIGYQSTYQPTCSYGSGGADRVYQVTPLVSGTLRVSVGDWSGSLTHPCAVSVSDPRCFDAVLYAHSGTCTGPQIACADATAAGEHISLPVTAGVPTWLFVDGYDDAWYSRGVFDLELDLSP